MRPRAPTGALALLLAAAGCAAGSTKDPPDVATVSPAPTLALLPAKATSFAPSHMKLEGAPVGPGATLADVDACGVCHADVAAQWRTSAHAFASMNNPVYRAVVDRFRKDRGKEKSRFCGGCHDTALLVDGAMDREIVPADLRAHAGITCRTCHGISSTRPDGNASFTLDVGDIPIPEPGNADSVRRHKERAAPAPLRTSAMCASCHRAFLDETTGNAHHLIGQDDATPWARSVYAGSRAERVDAEVPEADCRGCHMPREDATRGDPAAKRGRIASHRFLGGHTWLAAMRGDRDQLRRAEELLRTAASIDVAAVVDARGVRTIPAEMGSVTPGERVVLEVVVKNQGTGHRFPGGTLDAQDVWIELTVDDAHGTPIAEAGTRHEASGDDPTAHRFTAIVADAEGTPLLRRETHVFAAGVANTTLPPRDAVVVRYAFDAPARVASPVRVVARLRHRSRNLALQELACSESRTVRGRAFGREGLRQVTRAIDPCTPEPVLEIARAEVGIGRGSPLLLGPRRWDRLFEHGLGMLHEVQERLEEARPSLLRALETAENDRQRAMAAAALADLAARQGATDDALAWAGRAAAFVPAHPALARIRGAALASAWRWSEAAPYFFEAASASPKDDAAWARLAITYGGISRDRDAIDAAQRGLLSQPRDPDLLRAQALALGALGADSALVARATDAFLERRTPDDAPAIRSKCSAIAPGCALERLPVHVHEMRKR